VGTLSTSSWPRAGWLIRLRLLNICVGTLVLNIHDIVETGLYPKGFKSNNFFDQQDEEFADLDPQLGELLYSDQPPSLREVERKATWLSEAYGPIA
jgi:hypothetical protein